VSSGEDTGWARQLIFDKAAAGSLKQLQEHVLSCQSRESLEAIQVQILTIIEDKTKEILLERNEGIISANVMVADELQRTLRLTHFSRHSKDRHAIMVSFDSIGAGKAIQDMKTVYTRDTKSPDLQGVFRDDAPYRSILSMPIACDHKGLGVVNVDSTKPDAFGVKSLEDHLAPYVQLIGLSLCLEGGSAHGGAQ
jgi:putative methionine-R-sulfoxide reductase with GAF domain